MNLWILKLGGSIITDKQSGKPIIEEERIKKLCSEIAAALQQNQDLRLVVLHGAGSLGHPQVKKYDLVNKPLTKERLLGMGETMANMRLLTDKISEELRSKGVPALPLQTSSLLHVQGVEPICTGIKTIKTILKSGGVPVLGGDTVVTEDGRVVIASADMLAMLLGRQCDASRILFGSNVDGVYASFPPADGEQPIKELTRQQAEDLSNTNQQNTSTIDVTGEMQGKLKALLEMNDTQITIFNGKNQENLRAVLAGEAIGTVINL